MFSRSAYLNGINVDREDSGTVISQEGCEGTSDNF